MKRLLITTIGKTHSGKSTFAKKLEEHLSNAIIVDQDNHATFVNTYYNKLQLNKNPNQLKIGLSKYILDFTIKQTNLHIILCNSNINQDARIELMESFFPKELFLRIIVHFNINDALLLTRITESKRSTTIFRDRNLTFEQLLANQSNKVDPPDIYEADYIFTLDENTNQQQLIEKIVNIQINNIKKCGDDYVQSINTR